MLASLLALLVGSAGAWEGHGATWAWEDAPVSEGFELNVGSFPYDEDDVDEGFQMALDIWNAQGESYVYLKNSGRTTDNNYGGGDNGHNTTRHTSSGWGSALALATWNTYGGGMADCDIEFYGANTYGPITWSFARNGASGSAFDFTQTSVHELGHCLGFNHSGVSGAVMGPTNSPGTGWERRLLTNDEVSGLQAMYGAGEVQLEVASFQADPAVARPGELVELTVQLRNAGDAPSVDVLGVLLAEGAVQLIQDASEIGDLPPGSVRGVDADVLQFSVRVNDTCSGGEARVQVQVEDLVGNEAVGEIGIALDCGAAGSGGDPAVDGDPSGSATLSYDMSRGCGCVGGGTGSHGWLAVGLVALGLRRRTR